MCNSCGTCWRRTLILLSFLRAAARSQASCIRNHVSSVLPNAFVSRIAISGLIPDFPLTMLLSACCHRQAQRHKAIMPNDATGMHGVFHEHGGFLLS